MTRGLATYVLVASRRESTQGDFAEFHAFLADVLANRAHKYHQPKQSAATSVLRTHFKQEELSLDEYH